MRLPVARDGSLLIGEDTNNTIYRVSYGGENQDRQMNAIQMSAMARWGNISMMLTETQSASNITVRSESFGNNQPIPDRHSAYHQDQSPQLNRSGSPSGAKSFVVMVEDPDALSSKPFVHWLVANIPATTTE